MRKFLIGALVAVVAVVGAVWLYNSGPDTTVSTINDSPPPSETNSSRPQLIIGDPEAKLTIIEYGDFQCPICKRFFEQTEPQLLSTYIDTNKAKIEFRVETHIGPESAAAGEAAYCANDQGQFKAYHDELYRRQGREAFNAANLKAMAARLGLSRSSFDQCLDSGKYAQVVEDSNAEAQARISGTPTFFIGDQTIVGAQPFSSFKAVIDAKL